MAISYKFQSKIYGLLDIFLFRNNSSNPRYILLNKIQNTNLKLLEVAVGTAKNSILLAKHNPKMSIIGIDLSDEMLKIAQNNVKKEKIENVELLKMDGANMEFENESFDFIVISLLLHEIPEKIADIILKKCLSVLKQKGKLYVIELEEPKKLLQKIIFFGNKLFEPKEYKVFMKKDLDKYFLKNGFQIKTVEYGNYSKVIELEKSATST
jgi:ubiquinone/menaquinone biosynthesis C-methylase UbiE